MADPERSAALKGNKNASKDGASAEKGSIINKIGALAGAYYGAKQISNTIPEIEKAKRIQKKLRENKKINPELKRSRAADVFVKQAKLKAQIKGVKLGAAVVGGVAGYKLTKAIKEDFQGK